MAQSHDSYACFRFPAFRSLTYIRFLGVFSLLLIETVIGWHLYEKTSSAFVLGFVGLLEIIPVLLFSLYAGNLADRCDRQKMAVYAQSGFLFAGLFLTICSAVDAPVPWIYTGAFILGTSRAFNTPANSTLIVRTVPSDLYSNAAAWSSNVWQLGAMLGPTCGGFLVAITHSATVAYGVASVLLASAIIILARLKLRPAEKIQKKPGGILEGFSFLLKNPLVLSVISLDLFAVLLGGATALLPIYARDILKVGPEGLGWLRAAPSFGAVLAAFFIAHRPPFRNTGITLLSAVTGFGIATAIFGISTSFPLSFFLLFLTGVFDSVSVIVRSTLLLISVPDDMRGRVSAINSIFVGSSNELGAFESGVVAHGFGAIFSVVSGGIGTICIALLTACMFPQLRQLKNLVAKKDEPLLEDGEMTGKDTL